MKQKLISLAVVSAFASLSWIPVTAHAASSIGLDASASHFAVIADHDGGDGGDGDGGDGDGGHCKRHPHHCDGDDGDDGGDS